MCVEVPFRRMRIEVVARASPSALASRGVGSDSRLCESMVRGSYGFAAAGVVSIAAHDLPAHRPVLRLLEGARVHSSVSSLSFRVASPRSRLRFPARPYRPGFVALFAASPMVVHCRRRLPPSHHVPSSDFLGLSTACSHSRLFELVSSRNHVQGSWTRPAVDRRPPDTDEPCTRHASRSRQPDEGTIRRERRSPDAPRRRSARARHGLGLPTGLANATM